MLSVIVFIKAAAQDNTINVYAKICCVFDKTAMPKVDSSPFLSLETLHILFSSHMLLTS